MNARAALLSSLLATPTFAQIPVDGVLVLETPVQLMSPTYRLLDAFGRGGTVLRQQNVFMLPSPNSVAVDPNAPGHYWFSAATTSLPGTWRSDLGLLAAIGTTQWGPWATVASDRLEVGSTRVFTLTNGVIESRPKVGGSPSPLFTLANAIDIAVLEPKVYVAAGGSGAAPLVEYDLPTGTSRTVGSYADMRSLAVSPFGNELCIGTASGDVSRIDVATGAVLGTFSPGIGSIRAVGYTRFATLVWASSQEVWSELAVVNPMYVSSTSIVDLGVSQQDTASIVPFAAGCGAGTGATWVAPSPPNLGNAGFTLGVQNAPASSFALLVLGASRSFSTVFGAALPIDLTPVGATGCALLVDPLLFVFAATSAAGAASHPLPLPNTPSLAGAEWCGQWLVPDASVGPLGLATTEGAAFVLF